MAWPTECTRRFATILAMVAALVAGFTREAAAQSAARTPLVAQAPDAQRAARTRLVAQASAEVSAEPAAAEDVRVEPAEPSGAMPARKADLDDDVPETPPAGSQIERPLPYRWENHRFAFEGQIGAGTPLGILGVSLDYAPLPALVLNAGVGLGAGGLQAAVNGRVRFLRWGHRYGFALYAGAGASLGPYVAPVDIPIDGSSVGDVPAAHYHFDMAYWANGEVGIEMQLKRGFLLRPFFGVGLLLNPHDGTTVLDPQGNAPSPLSPWLPYGGVAFGYVFGS